MKPHTKKLLRNWLIGLSIAAILPWLFIAMNHILYPVHPEYNSVQGSYSEGQSYSLEAIEIGKPFGHLPNGDKLYEIKGQPNRDYVIAKNSWAGYADVVSRKGVAMPYTTDPRNRHINEIQIMGGAGMNTVVADTKDPQIVQDYLTSSMKPADMSTVYKPGDVILDLRLISPDLPGLYYSYSISYNLAKQTTSNPRSPETSVLLGPHFTAWALHAIKTAPYGMLD